MNKELVEKIMLELDKAELAMENANLVFIPNLSMSDSHKLNSRINNINDLLENLQVRIERASE